MRALAQPEVLRSAVVAAMASSLACLPRLLHWNTRYPIWYLEARLFLAAIVLWAFVIGWHEKYSGGRVFTARLDLKQFCLATLAGIGTAAALYVFVDPAVRPKLPDDYPQAIQPWLAQVLFELGLTQLFLVFAPFAWMIRLSRNRALAFSFTVLFGVAVLWLKHRTSAFPLATPQFLALLAYRIVGGALALLAYLRGGLLLASWWSVLIQSRLLLELDYN